MSKEETERYLKMTDGFNLFCRYWKSPIKAEKTVVCIHGLGGHSGCFAVIGRKLASAGIDVCGIDLRGFGNSKEPNLPRGDTQDFKRHLQDIDETFNILRSESQNQKLFMLGHSLGGLYALWYGAKYPENLDGLIIAAPAIENKPKMTPEDRAKLPFLITNAPQTMIDTTKSSTPKPMEEPELKTHFQLVTRSFSARYFAGVGATLMRDKAFSNASEVKKSTLILQGDADEDANPAGAQRLFESLSIKDKTLAMIPGAGHALFRTILSFSSSENNPEKRDQVLSTIVEWIKKH